METGFELDSGFRPRFGGNFEEATTRMPSSYMARLRDQNERVLALLEELLQETPPVPERVPEAAERPLETADGPSELPKKEEGEVSGRINDLRVKYATEGGRRGWGI